MFRIALPTAALAALLAAGAQAQNAPAAEPATPPAVSAPADGSSTAAPMTPAPHSGMTAADEAGWTATELGAISTDKLVGLDLVNYQNETIANIDDVLISNDNMVEGIVVTFGGVLGFGAQKVLLQPDEIEVMQDADHNLQVRTSLTPDAIESRPAYQDS